MKTMPLQPLNPLCSISKSLTKAAIITMSITCIFSLSENSGYLSYQIATNNIYQRIKAQELSGYRQDRQKNQKRDFESACSVLFLF